MTSKDDVKVTGEFTRIAVDVDDLWASITVQLNNLNIAHEQFVGRFWKEFDEVLKKLEAPRHHLKARWWNHHIPRVPPPDTRADRYR